MNELMEKVKEIGRHCFDDDEMVLSGKHKQARNPGTNQKRIANSDGLTNGGSNI